MKVTSEFLLWESGSRHPTTILTKRNVFMYQVARLTAARMLLEGVSFPEHPAALHRGVWVGPPESC